MITYRYSPCTPCVQSKHSPEEPGQDTSGNVFLITPLSSILAKQLRLRTQGSFSCVWSYRWCWDTNQGRNGSVFTPKTCPSAYCSDNIQSRTIYQVYFLLLRAKQHFSSLTKPVRTEGTVRQLRPIWRNQISLCLCLLSPRHHLCWTLKPPELSVNSEMLWNYSGAHQPCTRWLYGDEASRHYIPDSRNIHFSRIL